MEISRCKRVNFVILISTLQNECTISFLRDPTNSVPVYDLWDFIIRMVYWWFYPLLEWTSEIKSQEMLNLTNKKSKIKCHLAVADNLPNHWYNCSHKPFHATGISMMLFLNGKFVFGFLSWFSQWSGWVNMQCCFSFSLLKR